MATDAWSDELKEELCFVGDAAGRSDVSMLRDDEFKSAASRKRKHPEAKTACYFARAFEKGGD